jgi:two-component system response regulator NreC
MSPRPILLVDDHSVVRAGLRSVLAREAFAHSITEAASLAEARQAIARTHPRLIILDLSLPDGTGLQLLAELPRPAPPVLIVSMHTERRYVCDALRAGAQGYLAKENASEELAPAVRALLAGGAYLSPGIARLVVEELRQRPATSAATTPPPALSARETEVLCDLAQGLSTKEIGSRLALSPKTIEAHRIHLMRKLQLGSIADLTRFAIRHGLVQA